MNNMERGCMSARTHGDTPKGFTKLWVSAGIL